METSVTRANWRIAPNSYQSFHNVDKHIPVSRIEGPQRVWELTTKLQSLDSLVFEDQYGQERHLQEVLETTSTRSLVVLKGGVITAEHYSHGYDGINPHILFSISKSLTGAMTGILVDQGLLDPDNLAVKYIPEIVNSAYGSCTVRHVLDMMVSCSFSEEYLDQSGDYARYRRATLWNPTQPGKDPGTLHGLLANLSPGLEPHGKIFNYLSPNSDFLGWLIERASGQKFSNLFSDLIWKPMGAESHAYVTVDSEGTPRTAGGICAIPRDLARFGEMMRLGGKNIIPSWWIEDIRYNGNRKAWQKGDFSKLFPKGRYRSNWYQSGNPSGAYCAIGIHGQWLWIDPRREVVIVKVSAQEEPVNNKIDDTLVLTFEAISEAVN